MKNVEIANRKPVFSHQTWDETNEVEIAHKKPVFSHAEWGKTEEVKVGTKSPVFKSSPYAGSKVKIGSGRGVFSVFL